ncbi:MAG: hypothetical protein GYB64_19595 [Chloroflexi bacterium]|nr:hypothetical protein [Chloroflexota bacterium]
MLTWIAVGNAVVWGLIFTGMLYFFLKQNQEAEKELAMLEIPVEVDETEGYHTPR